MVYTRLMRALDYSQVLPAFKTSSVSNGFERRILTIKMLSLSSLSSLNLLICCCDRVLEGTSKQLLAALSNVLTVLRYLLWKSFTVEV